MGRIERRKGNLLASKRCGRMRRTEDAPSPGPTLPDLVGRADDG